MGHFELDLGLTEASLAVMRSREHRAEARSTKRLHAPRSVDVIGADATRRASAAACCAT